MPVYSAQFAAALRPLALAAAVAGAVHHYTLPVATPSLEIQSAAVEQGLEAEFAVSALLAGEFQLASSPSDVHFIDPPSWSAVWSPARVFVLGSRESELNDVYLAHVRLTPEGQVLSVARLFNLTETSAVSEQQLAVSDGLAAWLLGDEQQSYRLKLLDANRPASVDVRARVGVKRWQQGLTELQQTGQISGLSERDFKFDPPPKWVRISASNAGIKLSTEQTYLSGSAKTEHPIVIPRAAPMTAGAHLLSEQTRVPAAPGNLVTWAVDRVRALPWFGDDKMQLLKAVAFKLLDFKDRTLGSGDEGAPPPRQSFGVAVSREPTGGDGTRPAFPPPPLVPELDPPFDEEGVWLSLEKDPFVRKLPDGSSPFVTTFIRTDRERKFSRIFVTAWDPQVVGLHMMSGTEEPKSATGETGTGLIPRDPDTLSRLVGAFNGGFQGTHGDFGMQVEGTLYVPPIPYGATVARLEDGSVGFGTWGELKGKAAPVPEHMVSFRQNLTPLIQDGKVNPFGRVWWGGVPHEWEDDTRTVRSGLCLTKHGLVAYFYGSKVDHRHLAKAMELADCDYGLHLDMNQGHTGLEFYQAAPKEQLPPLGMPLSPMWQAEGPVEGAPEFHFRGRRLFRSMQLMNFPRYIRREARDFFYLTLRPTLPGPPLKPVVANPAPAEGRWTAETVLTKKAPAAIASTWLRPDAARPGAKVRLLALAPSLLAPVRGADAEPSLLSIDPPPASHATTSAWWFDGRFRIGEASAGQVQLFSGTTSPEDESAAAVALSRAGFLYYAEVATGARPQEDGQLLSRALRAAGASGPVLYLQARPLLSSKGRDLSGHPAVASPNALQLVASKSPKFRKIFTNTPVTKRTHWKPLQKKKP